MAAHFATEDLGATCRLCVRDADYRQRWNCDGATEKAVYVIPCPACGGAAAQCPRCKETGEELIYECPRRTVDPSYIDVVGAALKTEDGLWPERGGLNSQPLWFVEAREFVLGIVNEWRRRQKAAGASP